MKDMSTQLKTVFGTGIMFAMLLAAFAAFAQDVAEDDDLMPAVDTSAAVEDEAAPETAPDITRTTTGSRVMDSMELNRTEITGNQELPKVLYIVPWKSVERFEMKPPGLTSIMDQQLQPIDRASFKRTINYHQAINTTATPVSPALD